MKKYYPTIFAVSLLMILVMPQFAFAHDIKLWPGGFWGPIVSCGEPGNECKTFCDLLHTTQHVVYFALTLLLYAIVPIAIAWGGMLILVAGSSPERLKQGKGWITGAIIGAVIGLSAFLIINAVLWLGVKTSPIGSTGLAWPRIQCSVPAPK